MPRLLCLPGYLQSGKVFAEKSSGLRKMLTKKNFELDYVDPPYVIANHRDLPFVLSDNDDEASAKFNELVDRGVNRAWWQYRSPGHYEGFAESVEYLVQHIRKNGPYDGVMGFSQGAAMAAMLTNRVVELVPSQPQFTVAILISGFAFVEARDPQRTDMQVLTYSEPTVEDYDAQVRILPQYESYFTVSPSATTTVASVYGTADMTVPAIRSAHLAHLYGPRSHTFVHDGGHFVPNKKPFLLPIVDVVTGAFESTANL
ncbi:Serine hydrolase domain-containing protein [[Candida] zeylanoides]